MATTGKIITLANYVSEYNEFMKLYNEAEAILKKEGTVSQELNAKYVKVLEYSFRLTEFWNPQHELKYKAHDYEIIRDIYSIRASLLLRTIGLDTKKPSLTNDEKNVYHTVIALLRKCLNVDPLYAPAMELFKITFIYLTIHNLNVDENLSFLEQVLPVYPHDYQLQFNLGFVYQRKNNLEKAIEHFKLALGIVEFQMDRFSVLEEANKALGTLSDSSESAKLAVTEFQKKCPLDVNTFNTLKMFQVKCLNFLGSIYYSVQSRPLALYYFKRALEHSPEDPDINNQLGVVYTELRITDLAIKHYKAGIENYQKTHISTDLDMLRASMFMNMGLALCYQCDFVGAINSYNKALKYKPRLSLAYQNKLLDLNYISHLIDDPMYVPRLHKNLNNIYEHVETDYKKTIPGYVVKTVGQGKLNIGFVSGDFICHPVSYFISGVLRELDTSRFNITCYTGKLISVQEQFPNCKWVISKGMSREVFAEQIKSDKIDILFDLSAHTGDNRLDTFILKPAPIQISYCGYPGSSGIKSMDYHFTDAVADCKESEKHYTEKLVYLKNCFLNYTPAIGPDVFTIKEAPCVKNGYTTFGCFNRFNKINEMVIGVWEKILVKSGNARLIIKTKEFSTLEIKQKFLDSFKDKSVLDRIQILEYSDTYLDHLPDYNLMDISLDTFPYAGTTTSCESLFMGVPVLTLFDNKRFYHSQNVTSSLLKASDMNEFVTYSEDEYITRALELSRTVYEWKGVTRDKFLNGPVCNTKDFVKNFGETLESVYSGHKW